MTLLQDWAVIGVLLLTLFFWAFVLRDSLECGSAAVPHVHHIVEALQ